jgi:AraC-like DNA-binding protein
MDKKNIKRHFVNTKEVVGQFFDIDDEYFCNTIPEFVSKLKFPTPISKQSGVLMLFLSEGSLELLIGYEKIKVIKGQLVIIQPNKPYSIEEYSLDIDGYLLNLKGGSVLGSMGSHSLIFNLEFLETWSDSVFTIQKLPLEYIDNIFKRIYWEKEQCKSKFSIVNAYVITLLLELNSIYNEAIHSNRAAIDIVRKFKNEVYLKLDKQFTIVEYAELLCVTPNHLNKAIKTITGLTALELVNKIKITEAKYLLMISSHNISDVAEKLGFSDASYFSRFFKKHTFLSPKEFLKMIDLSC